MTDGFRYLSVTHADGVTTCTMSNPPNHTLVAEEVRELHRMLDGLDATTRVLVLTGADPNVFIAHYEVGELADAADAGRPKAPGESQAPRLHPMNRLTLRLEALPQITIAAVNGNAAGGGAELALGCDFRLLKEGDFRFGLPETSVGIIPGAGGTQRFARLLGTARALDLILHARLLTPEQALQLGLAHRVFPASNYAAEVRAFAADLAERAPVALAAAKRAIVRGAERPLEEGLLLEQDEFDLTMRSEDAAGAMRAWLRGESWRWRGR